MTNNKVTQAIFNSISENVQKLSQLFPSSVKDGEVDLLALKEELGNFKEIGNEKYDLTWAGKQNAKKLAQEDILGKTLKFIPAESKNPESTNNIYIEGDNLEVLKLLRQNYYGAIKMIYIDPPYNTGNDFVYNDNFDYKKELSDALEGEIVDGERMIVNQKSSNRYHANWLNMLFPRLRIAKDLLTDDGVIFISIDDNELSNLIKIGDEIFGENNLIDIFSWKKTETPANLSKLTKKAIEYIVSYKKSDNVNKLVGLKKDSKSNNGLMNQTNSAHELIFPANKVDTGINDGIILKGKYGTNNYEILLLEDTEVKDGWFIKPIQLNGKFKWSQENLNREIACGVKISIRTAALSPSYEREDYEAEKPWNIIDRSFGVGTNENASKELDDLLGINVFDFPKPTSLIKYLINSCTIETDTIIDFFSGSATTAEAVLQLNSDDGGTRKFIMVQFPEKCDEKSEAYKAKYINICEIGEERIRRAGERIKSEIQNAQIEISEEPKHVPDIGFKVFRVSETNIRWTHEALRSGQIDLDEHMLSKKDQLDFMPNCNDMDVVYEIMLRQRDIPLSSKVEKLEGIGERSYIFADSYVVCLEELISPAVIEKLAVIEPTPIKYIFRDSAFEDNISLKDETIRRLQAYVSRNTAEKEKAYTVEFI